MFVISQLSQINNKNAISLNFAFNSCISHPLTQQLENICEWLKRHSIKMYTRTGPETQQEQQLHMETSSHCFIWREKKEFGIK